MQKLTRIGEYGIVDYVLRSLSVTNGFVLQLIFIKKEVQSVPNLESTILECLPNGWSGEVTSCGELDTAFCIRLNLLHEEGVQYDPYRFPEELAKRLERELDLATQTHREDPVRTLHAY